MCKYILIKFVSYGCIGLMVIMIMSCNPKERLQPSSYVKYVAQEGSGLVKTKNIGEVKVKVQYKPISYIIANEIRSNQIKKEEYNKRYKELS